MAMTPSIVNYQATPVEEGFTASGALRLGVSEMTRFGMKKTYFQELAALMADVIKNDFTIKKKIKNFRNGFQEMQYCFKENDFQDVAASLTGSL